MDPDKIFPGDRCVPRSLYEWWLMLLAVLRRALHGFECRTSTQTFSRIFCIGFISFAWCWQMLLCSDMYAGMFLRNHVLWWIATRIEMTNWCGCTASTIRARSMNFGFMVGIESDFFYGVAEVILISNCELSISDDIFLLPMLICQFARWSTIWLAIGERSKTMLFNARVQGSLVCNLCTVGAHSTFMRPIASERLVSLLFSTV